MLSFKQSAVFLIGYVTLTAFFAWGLTAVLGLGDPKFGGGYGGFEIYFPLWLVFYSPGALLGVGAIFTVHASPTASWIFTISLLVALGLSMVVVIAFDDWPVLVAFNILFSAGAFLAARLVSAMSRH